MNQKNANYYKEKGIHYQREIDVLDKLVCCPKRISEIVALLTVGLHVCIDRLSHSIDDRAKYA